MAYEPASLVEPKTAAPAPAEPATPPAVEAASGKEPKAARASDGLPDELLQIPALQAIFSGAPPAVSAPLEAFAKRPEAKLIAQHRDALMKAGMGLYRSVAGDLGVLFNQLKISGAQIQSADKEGKLLEIAPPFDQINQQTGQSGGNNPVMTAQPATGAATPPIPTPSQTNSKIRGPVPSTQRARVKNLNPGGPSTGAKPGAGRLLNSILKPVL